jgi:hypothetical protein
MSPTVAKRIVGEFVQAAPKLAKPRAASAAAEFGEGLAKEAYSRGVTETVRAVESARATPTSVAGTVRGMLASLGFSSGGVSRLMRGDVPQSTTDIAIFVAKLTALGIVSYAAITALRRHMSSGGKESGAESGEEKSSTLDDID